MRTATKRTVANKGNEGYEFFLRNKDIIERANFGRFEIIKTKQGIMFKNYTGFHVWTTPYAVGTDGKAHETSLYEWMDELLDMNNAYKGHEDEPVAEDSKYTKGDVMNAMRIATEANLIRPMTAFIDRDKAFQQAEEHMKWLNEMQEKLKETMENPLQEETDEDLRKNAEAEAKAENMETLANMAKEEDI